MTAIYGLVNLDGAPARADDLRAMSDALADWGPDGRGVWHQAGAGFGQLITHTTPEAVYETGPITCDGGAVVVAAARLDNRAELCAALKIQTNWTTTTDSQIVAAAFQTWADATPEHLFGDWAFAAWDPTTRRLLVARDHYGNTALYYYHDARTFAFASSRKALFAVPRVPRKLNELRLAEITVVWLPDGAATLHEGISRLPPAHCVTVTADTCAIARYWKLEDVADVKLSSDHAYVERFLELYGAAVRARLRSRLPVATTLSSGLDSGSVAALAARELQPLGKVLTAFTAVPLFPEIAAILPGVETNEWPLAHLVASWYANIDHRAVAAEHMTPLAAIERSLSLHDEPIFMARHVVWTLALLEQCRVRGCGTVLVGHAGNGAGSWVGDEQRVARSFVTGRWVDTWQGLYTARQSARSWLGVVRSQLAAPLNDLVRGYACRWGGPVDVFDEKYRIINVHFARRLRLAEMMRATGYGPNLRKIVDVRAHRMQILEPRINPGGALWNEMGAGYQLDVRDPTADPRLLEFCIGIPSEQFRAARWDRWLMRRAVEGLLPPATQWNKRTGRQGADLPLRLRADAGNVERAITEIAGSETAQAYLDVRLLQDRWTSLQSQLSPQSYADASIVTRTLLIGLFLTRLG